MLTDLDREFVAEVAIVLREQHLLSAVPPAHWAGKEEVWRQLETLPGMEQSYVIQSAVFLGRLLELNERESFDDIVAAAKAAVPPIASKPFDSVAFVRAIVVEASGGASVSASFAPFTLAGRVARDDDECATCPCVVHQGVCGNIRPGMGRCKCTTTPDRYAFSVPSLTDGSVA